MTDYRSAGVDLEAADALVADIADVVTATWGPQVVGGFGGFAAGVRIPDGYRRPVLMLSTDGVGTKLDLARRARRWDGIGWDLVAMCADDLAAVAAAPIAFTDYIAVGRIDRPRETAIVRSIADACRAAGCALVGGETAEHPGTMPVDGIDVAGTALGVVEDGAQVTGDTIRVGDVVVGLASPNLRSNGFSLVRAVLADVDLDAPFPDDPSRTWADVLLEPSVIYAPAVLTIVDAAEVHGLAHVTGGGIAGNLVRILPDGLRAVVDRSSWTPPPVFAAIRRLGEVDPEEMYRVFNMGIGFLVVCPPSAVGRVIDQAGEHGHDASPIGWIETGDRSVTWTAVA